MGVQSPSEILKQLAQEMRCAVAACRNSRVGLEFPWNLGTTAGDIMDRVVKAGALDEPKYAHLRVLFEKMKEEHPEHWRNAVWALATSELLPEVGLDLEKGPVGHEDTCAAMANWIERETAKLEGGKRRTRTTKRGPKGARRNTTRDKQIWEAWQTKSYKTYAELARELGMTRREVELAIDNERHERKRKGLK